MKPLDRAKIFALKFSGAIVIGNLLFREIVSLPANMPYGVDLAVRRALHLAGQDRLANPDDMDVVVGLAVAVITAAIGAVIMWGGHALVRRMAGKRARLGQAV